MEKIFAEHTPFFIAEVGQNHQGDLDLALEYIKVFSELGANAIKFQTRNNKYLFSEDAYNAPYVSDNSFSDFYGEHREKLELRPEWLKLLKKECIDRNVLFMSTPFDEPSLDLLISLDIDILKVASFDLGNLPFLAKIARTKKPIVLSIGGGNHHQIQDSIKLLKSFGSELSVLHCVSEYPCPAEHLGFENIPKLKKEYPDCVIGSSDHFNGILSGPIAWMMGARVFEKHVTLNRAWKGTDHGFALEREGFRKFVRDINRTQLMFKEKNQELIGQEPVFKKLGKSLVASKDISEGEVLSLENLSGKIFKETYIPVRNSNEVLGRILKKDIQAGNPIKLCDLV